MIGNKAARGALTSQNKHKVLKAVKPVSGTKAWSASKGTLGLLKASHKKQIVFDFFPRLTC
jgi:hypothetical protein